MGKKRRSTNGQRGAPRRESTTIADVPAGEGGENKRPRSDSTGDDAPKGDRRRDDDEREKRLPAHNRQSRVDEAEAVTTTIDEKNGKRAKKRKKRHERGKLGDDEGDQHIGLGGRHDDGAATSTKAARKRWWSDLPWRSVDEGEDHDKPWEDDDGGYNHYDDPDADPDELFRDAAAAAADGGMGMMFGSLEVVDGSLYEVKRGDNGGDDNDDGAVEDKSPLGGKERVERGSHSLAEKGLHYGREEGHDEGEEVVSAEGSSTAKEQEVRRSEKEKDSKGRSESTIKDSKGTKSEPTNEDAEAKPISERQQRRREKRRLAKREKKARKKRARREAEEAAAAADADPTTRENDPTRFTEEEVSRLGENWNASCNYGAPLHVTLCRGLLSKGFAYPTPIQAATLPAACLGRRNVVGAAPTGSGKTLAYALPMLNSILTRRDEEDEHEEDGSDNENGNDKGRVTSQTSEKGKGVKTFLQGLVVCPTRELALQVRSEIRDVCLDTVKSVALVGGLASQKQARVLNGPVRPEIVVATPGRLWELMSSGDHPHLRDFSNLRFVVVDEADRMVLQGSFPQLRDVFTLVAGRGRGRGRHHPDYRGSGEGVADDARSQLPVRRNRREAIEVGDDDVDDGTSDNGDAPDDDDIQGSDEGDDPDNDDDSEGGSSDCGRLRSIAGVRGEARVTMLDQSILDGLEKQRLEGTMPLRAEVDDKELADLEDDGSWGSDAVGDAGPKQPVQRQTFVYSATLTLPAVSTSYGTGPSGRNSASSPRDRRDIGKKKRRRAETGSGTTSARITGAIAEILDIVGAQGQTKVVDLTSANAAADMVASDTKSQRRLNDAADDNNECNKEENGGPERDGINIHNSRRLPPGLSLYEVKCTQRHKDSHCYAYLTTTRHGSSGPCLIFCNSIAGVRRVGEMLNVLGLPVRTLHAQKAQKSRFKALDTLRKPGTKSRAIVVATDVAARGLDIPSVSTIIHYDVARTIDTFIHRSGRTARGVGEGAVGSSISLVSPGEEVKHRQILEAISGSGGRRFTSMPIDGRLLSSAQERTALAAKIILCDAVQNKATKQNKWFEAAAAEAEMETDEHLVDQGLLGGTCRDRLRLQEAKKARVDLQELLSRPMRKQNFGKFLSSAGLAAAVKAEAEVVPHVVHFSENTTRKKHRKPRTRTFGQRPC